MSQCGFPFRELTIDDLEARDSIRLEKRKIWENFGIVRGGWKRWMGRKEGSRRV